MKEIRMLAAAAALLSVAAAPAYDFRSVNGGAEIYYNITGEATVEVTYSGSSTLYASYHGHLAIPAEVSYRGRTYTVTAIGAKALAWCAELESLSLPATIERIGDRALLGCSSISEIHLPEGLATVGAGAFAWCDALESVQLPSTAVDVSPTAFDGCRSLTDISVAAANPAYSSRSGILTDRSGAAVVIYPAGREGACATLEGVTAIGPMACYGSALSEVALPSGLETIGRSAFYFSNSLSSIAIPASVREIGAAAFADCFSLEAIDVDSRNPYYTSEEGMLFDKDGAVLLQCPGGIYDFPDIPSTTREIGAQAFMRCCGLSAVELPEGLEMVGDAAYIDCQAMATAVLPSTLKRVGSMAFAQCTSLQQVYIAAPDPRLIEVGEEVFANTPLELCVLYVPYESVDLYRYSRPWSEFGLIQGYKALQRQTIEWEQSLKPEVGDHATLHAKASSGLPVQYRVSALSGAFATIDHEKVYFTDRGRLIITATQEGNHEYLPASPVTLVVDVKGTQGIELPEDTDNIRVSGRDGLIRVHGAAPGTTVRVYTVDGVCVYSGQYTEVRVAPGTIYIVRVASRAFKLSV